MKKFLFGKLLFVALALFLITSCNKDTLAKQPELDLTIEVSQPESITMKEAKIWFENKKESILDQNDDSLEYFLSISPNWKETQKRIFLEILDVIEVTFSSDFHIELEKGKFKTIVFFKSTTGDIRFYIDSYRQNAGTEKLSINNAYLLSQVSDGIPLFDICAWESFPFASTGNGEMA